MAAVVDVAGELGVLGHAERAERLGPHDVGEPDDDFGMIGEGGVRHSRQQPRRSVTSTQAPDCVERRIGQRAVEIGQALGVRAREVAVLGVGVFANNRLVAKGLAAFHRPPDVVPLQNRSGRCDQPDAATGFERRRADWF
ncbi:MAG: hypothetical protein IH805_03120 [Proteobacteria bacterium]|nr:hypothetical protein [Pseudomonadota bacterium]